MIALCLSSVRLDSAVSDEPAYLAAGMIKTVHGRLDFFRGQPPLMNTISAAPLVIAGYRMPDIWRVGTDPWTTGRLFLYGTGYDAHRMLLLARIPTILLFAALCWAVALFVARETASGAWGLFAFALTGFSPNLMAHGRLATLDVPVALFCFVAAVLLLRLLERPTLSVAIALGGAAAAAVLTKTSANLLAPWAIVILAMALVSRRVERPWKVIAMAAVALLAAAAFLSIWILVQGSSSYMRDSFGDLPRVLVPFAEYIENIRAVREWYARGWVYPQFLLGEFSRSGWWYYYPVALALKLTIPSILLIAIAAVLAAIKRAVPFAVTAMLLFAAMFLAVAMAGQLALGVRHVLPILPFVFAAVTILMSRAPRLVMLIAVALLAWHAGENVRAWPSYISHFNQLIGSHRNADRYLIDSNLDWGQDLRRTARWARERGIGELVIHYFGGGVPDYDLQGIRVIGGYGAGGRPLPKGSWFVLSRHFYRISFTPAVSRENYEQYLARSGARYVTTIGGSINIYRVE